MAAISLCVLSSQLDGIRFISGQMAQHSSRHSLARPDWCRLARLASNRDWFYSYRYWWRCRIDNLTFSDSILGRNGRNDMVSRGEPGLRFFPRSFAFSIARFNVVNCSTSSSIRIWSSILQRFPPEVLLLSVETTSNNRRLTVNRRDGTGR